MIIIDQFLADTKIMILDSQFANRVALKQSLLAFGAVVDNIFLAKNLNEARHFIENQQIKLIFSDYFLEDGTGTDLIKGKKEAIFILVSSVATSAVIANAAEVEVDQFIFKPYSQSHLKEVISGVVQKIVEPVESSQYIEDAKTLLEIGEFEKASRLFEQAKDDPQSFARACSYLAEIKKSNHDLESAYKSFLEGLSSSDVHFRCLQGVFNSLFENDKKDESYAVLKDILVLFPESSDRLTQALNLAVQTKNFVDIEEMYLVFELIYNKPDQLLNYMAAALLVNGHYHLKHKNPAAALESFTRGISVGQCQEKFVRYVQKKMLQYELKDRIAEVIQAAELKVVNKKVA